MDEISIAEIKLASAIYKAGTELRNLVYDLEERIPSSITIDQAQMMREAADLVHVLASIAKGRSFLRAMGAPGDWGYGHSLGDNLLAVLSHPRGAR